MKTEVFQNFLNSLNTTSKARTFEDEKSYGFYIDYGLVGSDVFKIVEYCKENKCAFHIASQKEHTLKIAFYKN